MLTGDNTQLGPEAVLWSALTGNIASLDSRFFILHSGVIYLLFLTCSETRFAPKLT